MAKEKTEKTKIRKWKAYFLEEDLQKLRVDPTQSNKDVGNALRAKLGLKPIAIQRGGAKKEIIETLKAKGIKVEEGLSTSKLLKLAVENLK